MKESNTKSNLKNTEGKSRIATPPPPRKPALGLTKLKANDFRINNLCQDQKGNLLRVSVLMDNGNIQFTVVNRSKFPLPDGWQAEPIPLDEKWLLNFGFEYRKVTDDYFIQRGEQKEIFIINNITAYLCESNSDKKFLCNLEFVHELQNLYHALTGKELEPKK